MSNREDYGRISFEGGAQPADMAYVEVTMLPMDRYDELTGKELTEAQQKQGFVSLQQSALGVSEAALLVEVHAERLMPYRAILERLGVGSLANGQSIEQANHSLNVLALGMMIGSRTAEITSQYADQGFDELDRSL